MRFKNFKTHPAPAQKHCGTTPLAIGDYIKNSIWCLSPFEGDSGNDNLNHYEQ